MASGEIRIGTMATLVGPFTTMGQDGIRGVELAIAEFGGQVAGKKITLYKESTNAIPDSAVEAAETLLNQNHVDFIIGPLSGNEGIAIREYAKRHPHKAFINGTAAGQDMTLRNPAPNFFSFSTNGVQWMAGLGKYSYHTLDYERIVTVAETYSYPFAQVGGFMLEFCHAGGRVIQKFWVALGTTDFRGVIAAIPEDVDAIFVTLAGADAVHFLEQYHEMGRSAPLIGGTSVIDQTVLNVGSDLASHVVGMISASPLADDNPDPAWQAFVAAYRQKFPKGLPSPSLFALCYYVNTKAALLALEKVGGHLSEHHGEFMEVLQTLAFVSPTGPVRLDHNRNAIANNFVREVAQRDDGTLYNKLVQIVPEVNQTLGISEDEYLRLGVFDQNNPDCP
jgi:branched-chain amino acid transport system substrate-binding protein